MEGKNSEALAAMKKCQDNAEQMVHAPEYRDKPWVPLWNLARAEDGLGDTQLALRNRSEAKLHYEEGLGLRRKWLKLNQETSRAEEAVAISLARLGAFHRREDSELPTALDYYQQCLELRRKLHEGHVDDPRIQEPARMQFEYGGTLMSVGGVHKRLGERKEALEHLNAAIPHLRAALRKWQEEEAGFQDEYAAEGNIAITYGDIGELYLLSKDFHAAEASYVEAVNRLRKLHQSDVDQREIRRSLWKCLYGLGTVHLASSPDAAQEAFEEVLRLSPDKSVERAYALARCHLPDQAAVILAELKERYQASPNGLYYVACGYALCNWSIQHRSQGDELDTDSKAQLEFSDQAIATLRAAISGGYNNLAELEHNPELDSLRGHNDFVRLLAQLASSSGVANGQPLDR